MKKQGKANETITTTIQKLKRLDKQCNINNPEEVKEVLANTTWKNSSKHNVAVVYTGYLKYIGKKWERPKYKKQTALPFIPTEKELDTLIDKGTPKTSLLLQLLKETGARIGEATETKWTDIDLKRKTIHILAEKGSNSRILPISNKLINMLNKTHKQNEKIFPRNKHTLRITYEALRKRTANTEKNPRLNRITFHTFRHWKATTEYHNTKDIIHVKQLLGHKSIDSTMVYINIESATHLTQHNQYTCTQATTIEEITKLIENGHEYITDVNGVKLFRKRK